MIFKIIMFNLEDEYVNVEELVLRGIEIVWFITIIYLYNRKYKLYWFPWFIAVLYVYGSVIALLPGELNKSYDASLENLEFMLFMLLNCYATGLFLRHVNLGLILQICIWLSMELVVRDIHEALMTIYILGYAALNSLSLYNRETVLRVYSNIKYIADKEIQKTDKLLIQMMPPHVYENLRDDKSITDKLPDVTLIYADIVGFTAWSSNKRPEEVVDMLSELFTRFDKMCVELNVYKVHTIGDCYVVMSYTGKAKRDITQECLKMVKMAESMIKIIEDINYENGSELNMRIGIHTGEVIAGIIGTNIIRYDIYGADALIANKMESSGSPGKINVSDVTKSILEKYSQNDFVFLFNKQVELPTIHRTHYCYFLRSAGSYVEGEE
jgi:phospholipid-translocating ATPase